jgi:hypothetical protein
MSQDNSAHIEARALILEHAIKLEKESEDPTAQTFAGAVREYLQAELLEPCLHLHSGTHVGPCPSSVVESVKAKVNGRQKPCQACRGRGGPHAKGSPECKVFPPPAETPEA